MSEPLVERLSRFTPDSTGLDRDALLFAAGRASARPNRRWLALAGTLAASQVLTLALLWPRGIAPTPVPPGRPEPPVAVTAPAPPLPSPLPEAPPAPRDPSEVWALRDRVLAAEGNLSAPAAVEPMTPADPPLCAGAAFSVLPD